MYKHYENEFKQKIVQFHNELKLKICTSTKAYIFERSHLV